MLPMITNLTQPSADQEAIDNRSCLRLSEVMEEAKGKVFGIRGMLHNKSYGLCNSSMMSSISVLHASPGSSPPFKIFKESFVQC